MNETRKEAQECPRSNSIRSSRYYQDGRLVKKVKTQQNIRLSEHGLRHLGVDCGPFVGQAGRGPDFQTQSIPTALTVR